MRKIKIKSFILDEEGVIEEITLEEFKKLPKVSEKDEEAESMALRVPIIRMEKDSSVVEVNVSDEDFNKLCYVFKLYRVPIKYIRSGVELDIRAKEEYPFRERMP